VRRRQIQQAALILMVNAAEAMPGGGRLTVATQVDGTGEAVQVKVRDTGSGIPAEVLPQIFDPFFTTKEDQQRTGLGLAVARSIVEHTEGRSRCSRWRGREPSLRFSSGGGVGRAGVSG